MTRLRSNRVRFRNFSIGFAREDTISEERTDARGTKSISPTKSRLLFGLALLLVKDHYLPNRMLGIVTDERGIVARRTENGPKAAHT